jgi:hypothetical protein
MVEASKRNIYVKVCTSEMLSLKYKQPTCSLLDHARRIVSGRSGESFQKYFSVTLVFSYCLPFAAGLGTRLLGLLHRLFLHPPESVFRVLLCLYPCMLASRKGNLSECQQHQLFHVHISSNSF